MLVFLHFCEQVFCGQIAVILAIILFFELACLYVERHAPVPSLLVFLGRSVSLAFLGVDVDDDRVVDVLHFLECLDECLHIVAIGYILIVQAHGTEEVALCLAVGLTQKSEVLVETTMVLGDAHLVVVHHDDDACAEFASLVETFECLAAAQRAVTYHYHDVLLGALDVASLLQTGGKGDGGRGVAELKLVVSR